jgi:DNA helicase-2/ATP-dependent DNA helicase PcrA
MRRDINRLGKDDEVIFYDYSYLFDLLSLFKNTLHNSFSKWLEDKTPEQKKFSLIYEDIIVDYENQKREFGFADFNDLLIEMKKKFDDGLKVPLVEVLVDEYQDTNLLQNGLIDSFTKKSLFCVGDYDQSIYAFNGANIEIITSFSKRYDNTNVFSLNKNYRSSPHILELANRVISHNPRIYPKKLEVLIHFIKDFSYQTINGWII